MTEPDNKVPRNSYLFRLAERICRERCTLAAFELTPGEGGPFEPDPTAADGRLCLKAMQSAESIARFLQNHPRLQQHFAFRLDYVPSRWLLENEIPVVIESRKHRDKHLAQGTSSFAVGDDAHVWARTNHLTGLCLSGGGIRSATFNLGILQGLASKGILKQFDYISSVSGGGYIHEWLAGWIKREDLRLAANPDPAVPTGFDSVIDKLDAVPFNDKHPFTPEPIRWLRRYSNYLTPQRGLFTADTWVAVAIWVRNTLLNQIVLISFLFFALLIPFYLARWGSSLADKHLQSSVLKVAGGLFFLASLSLWIGLRQEFSRIRRQDILDTSIAERRPAIFNEVRVISLIVLPLLLAAALTTISLSTEPVSTSFLAILYFLLLALLSGMALAGGISRRLLLDWGFYIPKRVPWKVRWAEAKRDAEQKIAEVLSRNKNNTPKSGEGDEVTWDPTPPDKPRLTFRQRLRLGWERTKSFAGSFRSKPNSGTNATGSVRSIAARVQGPLLSRQKPWVRFLAGFFGAIGWESLLNSAIASTVALGIFVALATQLRLPQFQGGLHVVLRQWPMLGRILAGHDLPPLPLFPLPAHDWIVNLHPLPLRWRFQITFGPPLLVLVPFLAIVLMAGLVGRHFDDWLREWIARVRAWCLLLSLGWIAFFGVALLGPCVVRWFSPENHYFRKIFASIKWTAILGWVGTTIGGVLAGKSKKATGTAQDSSRALNLLAGAAPYIFISGLLIILSVAADLSFEHARGFGFSAALLGIPLSIAVYFGQRVDINEFSMNPFYRNRLTRCYLGATNPARQPSPLTGLDDRDTRNLQISKLQPSSVPEENFSGPLPIINTTLNLSFGEELAWQERKAASFFFSPVFSGYTVGWTSGKEGNRLSFNGFVPTAQYYNADGGINIAEAVAISGAAASPNWGYHTNPATAFLMTLFNVRLGWWIANPRKAKNAGCSPDPSRDGGQNPSPIFAPLQLMDELIGRTDDRNEYVYLSDGGHFDNMGLYELVRRRCHRIVICDSECDEKYNFEGLGNAIRKCRIDFGVEIELPGITRLQAQLKSGNCKAHFVVGTIRYPETPTGPPQNSQGTPTYLTGTVIYLKSSLTGNARWADPHKQPVEYKDLDAEAADILNYKLQHNSFPHDTTANQWFTESQFESYRRLGQHVVEEAHCCNAWASLLPSPQPGPAISPSSHANGNGNYSTVSNELSKLVRVAEALLDVSST